MNQSSKEIVQPEQVLNSEQKEQDKHVSPAIGNTNVSRSLHSNSYQIDFSGNILCKIKVSGSKIEVEAAMNGYGNIIPLNEITVTPSISNVLSNDNIIKIETKNDLPKERMHCWFHDKERGWMAGEFLNNGKDEINFILANATHYKPIIKPDNPCDVGNDG